MKYLIVGLGNIGAKYDNTRHNIGFEVVDYLADAFGVSWSTQKLGDVTEFRHKGRTFVLLKPSTYMNLSGKSVRYWMQAKKIDKANLLVVLDDLHLPFGNSTIAGVGFDTGEIAALSSGDVLRVYSPLFENNYQLYMVNSANSSSGEITFNSPVANVNLQGTGFKVDTLVSNNSAFKNQDNYGIIRYFNEAGVVLDTYNSVAIKVVLRSEERRIVPKVDDIRVISVTA